MRINRLREMDEAELAFAGIARQAELIAAREISSRELVELCLDRIAQHDGRLNAFRVVFAERARLEAEQADARGALGWGGLEQDPRGLLGALGPQAAARSDLDRAALRRGSCLARPGGVRAAGAPGGRRGAVPRRHRAGRRLLPGGDAGRGGAS